MRKVATVKNRSNAGLMLVVVCGLTQALNAEIIHYTAASGVLPSSFLIDSDMRFEQTGAAFSSLNGNTLVVHDTSTTFETTFERTSPPIVEETVGAYEITMKVISANRPTLNMAGSVGFNDANKSIRIALLPDRVGFLDAGSGAGLVHSIPFDTTDGFHTYRVLKHGNTSVQLFIDNFDIPVIDVSYSSLDSLGSIGIGPFTQGVAYLWQGSNGGRSEVEIKEFAYNVGSTDIPEPATACMIFTAIIFANRRLGRKRGCGSGHLN